MVLQLTGVQGAMRLNECGMVKDLDPDRSTITAQNISKYNQYTFIQMQKEVECSGSFNNFKELEFKFSNLEDELNQYETYNGIDNFVKYFIKVQMSYQGGSMISGSLLEILHEFEVKNYYNARLTKKRIEDHQKQLNEGQTIAPTASVVSGSSSGDQTFGSTAFTKDYSN